MALTASKAAIQDRRKSTDSSYENFYADSRSGSVKIEVSTESPMRSLRKRTVRQEHPFRTDRVEHELAKKGLKASESDLREKLEDTMRPKSSRRSEEPAKKKSKHQKSISRPLSASPDLSASGTMARTWLNGVGAYIPIKLNMANTTELFDKIEGLWGSHLNGQKVTHCIVSFSWLDANDNLLLLRSDDGTAYEALMGEAARVLGANKKKDTINIHISV